MLDDANKLHLLFEILEELSSAKGHRDHYNDLYEETRKALAIRTRQVQTAMILLASVEFSGGVMGTCFFCGYKPHHSSCALKDLQDDVDYIKEHGIAGYGVDNLPVKR